MAQPLPHTNASRQELLSLLSLSGTLAGLSITIVAFIDAQNQGGKTVIDDVVAFCAAIFLINIYLLIWALRTRSSRLAGVMVRIADGLLLLAVTGMAACGFVMVYTVW